MYTDALVTVQEGCGMRIPKGARTAIIGYTGGPVRILTRFMGYHDGTQGGCGIRMLTGYTASTAIFEGGAG